MAQMNNSPLPNSDSRCLMENWFEERTSKKFDEGKSIKEKNIHGHDKILTLKPETSLSQCSEYKARFRDTGITVTPRPPRAGLLEAFLARKATLALKEGADPTEPKFAQCDYKTDYSGNICRDDFKSIKPTPKFRHPLYSELQTSYWSENVKTSAIHGVSQIKTIDSPFRKNASFSKLAFGEAWEDNQVMPGDQEFFPKL